MHTYLEILVVIGSLAGMMWMMLKFMLKDIHKEFIDIHKDLMDIKDAQKKSETRIDHLYQICIEMLGDRHK